jgi:ADP-ribose pyrophosphatase YjhB (NUDIX family)
MEERERPEEAARRELFEETRGTVDPEKLELFAVGSLPDISEVYIFLRGELESAFVGRTAEALDVRLFDESSAPWSELAYPELENVLRCFYHDHARKNYGVYCCDWSRGLLRFREAARGVG